MNEYRKMLCISLLWILTGKLLADVPTDYYTEAIDKTGVALKSALHDIITNHKRYSYKKVWDILQETDEDPNNAKNVILIYSRQSLSKLKHGGNVDEWNREHTWPKSHGFPQAGWPAYTDVHHLRPSLVTVNSARGVLDFDNGGNKILPEAPLVQYDNDSWEVPNEIKGDIARGIFYMAVRYEGTVANEPDLEITDNVNESQPNVTKIGRLTTLLEWHIQDPPNEQERLRNDKVFKWQGNRNPFIDHPEYVANIWQLASYNDISSTSSNDTTYDDGFDAGKQVCISNPSSCGITISDNNDCMANYSLAGQLYVPCVSVPDAFGGITVYDIKLNQQAGSFTFNLDMGSVKPR
jgi:endonuclease I